MGKSLMQSLGVGSKKSLFGWNWRLTAQTGLSHECSILMDIRELLEHQLEEQRRTNDLLIKVVVNGS